MDVASTPPIYTHMNEHLKQIIQAIDAQMGDGYAKKNPELVGRMFQANALLLSVETFRQTILFSFESANRPQ